MKYCNLNINIKNKKDLFEIDNEKTKCIVTLNAQIIRLANTNKDLYDFVNSNYATIDGQVPLKFARLKDKKFKKVENYLAVKLYMIFVNMRKKIT